MSRSRRASSSTRASRRRGRSPRSCCRVCICRSMSARPAGAPRSPASSSAAGRQALSRAARRTGRAGSAWVTGKADQRLPLHLPGWAMPMIASKVGAMSHRAPPSIRGGPGTDVDRGTGLSVWAVCGLAGGGSRICSALPWSAVIRSSAPLACAALEDPAEALVHRLDGLDRGLEVAGVADHVRVGVVADDGVVAAGLDRRDQVVGDLRGAHGSGFRS
jgi:hypothetical protein